LPADGEEAAQIAARARTGLAASPEISRFSLPLANKLKF